VEVLTSVIHGVPHDHVLVMPSSGWRESARKDEVSVVRYNGFNATIRLKDKTTKTIGMNHLALLVPPLNPATEKASAKAARLERELERVKDTLHRRMVAEGVARSWCGEFDPILDSNGLKPRKPKVMIRGVIEFAFEQDAAIAPGTVTKMRNGTHNVGNVVPSDSMRLIEIEQTDPIFTPLLS
jgi:hypothetical protein